MNDRQLVESFLSYRDEKSFRALYRSKTPHLYKMAYRLTQDKSQSNDLIQEMWIIAIRKLEGFLWRSELKTWLTGILINLVRSKRRDLEREIELDINIEKADVSFDTAVLNAYDLEIAISKLPPGYRQIVILHDIEGFKHHEIADLLDISVGTSKSQLFYARKTLRDYLSDDEQKVNKQ